MQKLYPPLPGGMKFANPPHCKFHTPQGYKISKKKFNKLRYKALKLTLYSKHVETGLLPLNIEKLKRLYLIRM